METLLDIKPTSENVQQLKKYAEKLSEYEQELVDKNMQIRALVIICGEDHTKLISEIEGEPLHWLRMPRNPRDFSDIPDNYFNIVLWSDCDLEAHLQLVNEIYPKIVVGGRIYFNNMLDGFVQVIKECLDKQEAILFDPKQQNGNFAYLVQAILQVVLKGKYIVHIIDRPEDGDKYVVLVKGEFKFVPSTKLAKQLAEIPLLLTPRISPTLPSTLPPTLPSTLPSTLELEMSTEQTNEIRNRVFDLVSTLIIKGDTIKLSSLCKQLVEEKLLTDCKVKGRHQDYLNAKHLADIQDRIELINEQIDALISVGIISVQDIISEIKDIIDVDLADMNHWEEYVKKIASEKLRSLEKEEPEEEEEEEESEEQEEEGEPEEEEEEESEEQEEEREPEEEEEEEELEEYPKVAEPKKPTPAVLLAGLVNIGGFSCFMDSVLFSILLPTSEYFAKNMLKKKLTLDNVRACNFFVEEPKEGLEYLQSFQQELRKLATIIRSGDEPELTCWPVVQRMRKCGPIQETLMSGAQQDDSEFLIALMTMFHLRPSVVRITRAVSADKETWIQTSDKRERIPVLEVTIPKITAEPPELVSRYQSIQISDYQNVSLTEWPKGPDDQPYRYSREKATIVDSNALIFHVARRIPYFIAGKLRYRKNTDPVIFKEYLINATNNEHYALQTVTIHRGGASGGHYTAYFKYGSQWFYYDDISKASRIRPAPWAEVVNTGSKNGSLYIYYSLS